MLLSAANLLPEVIAVKSGLSSFRKLAEVDQALLYDLRRTALTNMIEAGFSEKEAMEISGHKTRSVFDRYHIVSERRLNQLAERLEGHIRAKDLETTVSDGGIKQNAQLQ